MTKSLARFELIIFDWDGTIVDSAAQIVSAMQGAILELDLPKRSDKEISELIGLGLPDAIGRLFPELPTSSVMSMLEGYRRHWGHAIDNPAPLFTGMRELMDDLRKAGRIVCVATGKSRKGLDRSLRDSGLAGVFAHTRCADETASKPDPLMLTELLADTGISLDQSVMIGDTEYDMHMAQALGMVGLGVDWGVHTDERLLASGAEAVCRSVDELRAALSH